MKNLLITEAFKCREEQLNKIKNIGYKIIFVKDERLPLKINVYKIEVVVCNRLFLYSNITDFKSLRFVQLTSVGMDRVPLDYIRAKGIKLCNAKGVYSIPMAEWAILKILEIYKKNKKFHKNQEQHKWKKQRDLLELTDKIVTLVGFGDVSREIAKRLKPFGVYVIGVGKRKIKSKLLDEYYLIDNIDEALRKSDVIVLTLPLTKNTLHLIDENRIIRMKNTCVLLNLSRGGIIDEAALVETLKRKMFLGVALDVFEKEPLDEDSPLWDFDNVFVTPHNSFISDRVNERMFELITKNLVLYSRGEKSKRIN
jgi:phosphoglycerate dehydrogenase-like enzyme